MKIQENNRDNSTDHPEQRANPSPTPISLTTVPQRPTHPGNAMSDVLSERQIREAEETDAPARAIAASALLLLGQSSPPREPEVDRESSLRQEIQEHLQALRKRFILDELRECSKQSTKDLFLIPLKPHFWITNKALLPHLSYICRIAREYNLESSAIFEFLNYLNTNDQPPPPTLLKTLHTKFTCLVEIAVDATSSRKEISSIFALLTKYIREESADEAMERCTRAYELTRRFLREKGVDSAKGIRSALDTMIDYVEDGPQDYQNILKDFFWIDEGKTRGEDAASLLWQVSRFSVEDWKQIIGEREAPSLLHNLMLIQYYGWIDKSETLDDETALPAEDILNILQKEGSAREREAVVTIGLLPLLKALSDSFSFNQLRDVFCYLLCLPREQVAPHVQHLLALARNIGFSEPDSFHLLLRDTLDLAGNEELGDLISHATRIAQKAGLSSNNPQRIGYFLRLLEIVPEASRGEDVLVAVYQWIQKTTNQPPLTLLLLLRRFFPADQIISQLQQIFQGQQQSILRAFLETVVANTLSIENIQTTHPLSQYEGEKTISGLMLEVALTPPFLLPDYLHAITATKGPISQSPLWELLQSKDTKIRARFYTWLLDTAQEIVETHEMDAGNFLACILAQPTRWHLSQTSTYLKKLRNLHRTLYRKFSSVPGARTPVRIHRDLRAWAKEPLSLPVEEVGGSRLSWNTQKLQDLTGSQKKYKREDLPVGVILPGGISIFLKVYNKLRADLERTHGSLQEIPREELLMLAPMRKFLTNQTVRHFLFSLDEEVSEYSFYLYKIGEELQKRSQEKPPNKRLTDQQEWLRVLAEGVQNCEQGVEEGILQTYLLMRSVQGDSPAEPSADPAIQVSAKRVLSALEDLCATYLQPRLMIPEEFIGKVAGENPSEIGQIPHQRRYLQRLIRTRFGARDPHTETVHHRIVERARDREQRQEIRKLFFEKVMPIAPLFSSIEKAINEDINDLSPRKKKFGFTALVQFLTGEDPNAETVAKYFEEGDNGYKIKKRTVVEILERLGAVAVLGEAFELPSSKVVKRRRPDSYTKDEPPSKKHIKGPPE